VCLFLRIMTNPASASTAAAAVVLLLASPSMAADTLRLLASSAAGSIDPQINYTAQFWQVFAPVYDGLVAFRKVAGAPGTEIVPDLADRVEQDGLVYRFHLRTGVRFSDGSAVRPADVVASFRRIFRVGSPTADTFYGIIEGAQACLKAPDACELPGVRADGDVISITTTRADPEFLQKLALPHASVLPEGAPSHDSGTLPLPGTGPWRIARYDPNEALVLERNPYFHQWSADAQPAAVTDGVEYSFGLEAEAEVTSVLNGQADWMYDGVPPDRLAEVAQHPALVHIDPAAAIMFVALNVHEAPFNDVRVRRAFNMAVDRDAVVRLVGGHGMAAPLCQVVPPGLAGYVPYCPYPHDVVAARRLVAETGTAGQAVTLVVDDAATSRALGTYLVQVLGDLGYRARMQALSGNVEFSYIQNSNNHVQASLTGWYADYPSASNIIAGNFGCAAFRPGSDNSTNIPGFCDPALDAQLLSGRPGDVAAVDRAITNAAPAVVLYAPRYIDLVSGRVRDFVYHETWRWLMQRARVAREE
jgi:peptide/nickel transport system substrate-binding protein